MTDLNTRLIAGAMSGTSADGVDVAITRVTGRGLGMTAELVRHHHRAYDPGLREAIFALRSSGRTELRELARIGREVSLTYAAAVTEALSTANLKASDLAAIAAHGQTLFHEVPLTIQYFDPSLVAYEVGCPVVSDFRRADIAAGGQGAPLVPFADYILFRHPTTHRMLLNIGGIANVTCLFAGSGIDKVVAFDTGPGNCISDYLVRTHDPNGPGVDIDGALAAKGKVVRELADEFAKDSYFVPLGPKSTDGPTMIRLYERARAKLPAAVREQLSLEDELATACWLTAFQIVRARSLFGGQFEGELIVSGGGTKNRTMMKILGGWLTNQIRTSDEFGVRADAKEALAFALLGAATLDGMPSNVPSVTGARRGVVLGSITPRP